MQVCRTPEKFADYFSKAEFLQWLGCKVKNTWTGLVQVFFLLPE